MFSCSCTVRCWAQRYQEVERERVQHRQTDTQTDTDGDTHTHRGPAPLLISPAVESIQPWFVPCPWHVYMSACRGGRGRERKRVCMHVCLCCCAHASKTTALQLNAFVAAPLLSSPTSHLSPVSVAHLVDAVAVTVLQSATRHNVLVAAHTHTHRHQRV